MAKQFLTGLNLNKNELLNARIQNLASAPSSPVAGQIYYNTGDNTLRYWNGTSWLTLAQGGDLAGAIQAAIDLLDTDDIEEGSSNLYFTTTRARDSVSIADSTLEYDAGQGLFSVNTATIASVAYVDGEISAVNNTIDALTTSDIAEGTNLYFSDDRAQDAIANAIAAGTHSNITITYDDSTNKFTFAAENGVADSTTDNLSEGSTNKYFTDERAQDAVGNAVGTGLSYNDTTGAISVTANTYDAYGAANTVAGDLTTHISDTSTHGVTGAIVGTSDTQTLTNKTFTDAVTFSDGVNSTSTISGASSDLTIVSNSGDIILDADGDVYKGGAATAGNELITQNNLDTYIGDATVTGATGDTITDRITTAAAGALSDAQAYADALVQGLNVKDSVRTASAVAGTLATDFDNGSTVGGVTIATGDRILIKNQSTATENGIYVVAASGAPTRAADADPVADELGKGSYVLVTEGTYASTGWLVTAYSAGATTWTQFSAANEYTAGDGIDITGNEISVDLDSDSLSVSGNGLKVNFNAQGGLDNDSGVFINTGTGLTVNGSNQLTFAAGYGVQKYAASNTSLTPTSNAVTWTVSHNLNTSDVTIQMRDLSTGALVEADVAVTNANTVTITWVAAATVSADSYRVVVVG